MEAHSCPTRRSSDLRLIVRLRGAAVTKRWPMHILRVVLAAAGVQLWVSGLSHVPIWQAIALIMTSPFFVTIGARMMLGEAVGAERWGAVLVGFIGGMIILSPWSDSFTWHAVLPVGEIGRAACRDRV